MEKKSYQAHIILDHLFECGVFDRPNNSESIEVLPILPIEVASQISTTAVSCFNLDGSLEKIQNSEESINWFFQTISYCLSLTTLYQDSIEHAMNIFRYWLTTENFFKDEKTKNYYTRRIFKNLTSVFNYKNDNTFPDAREKLVLELISDFNNYRVQLGKTMEEETHDVFIRLLIGSSDFLLTNEAANYFTTRSQVNILSNIYQVLFSELCGSNLRNEIWDLFTKFCKKWSSSLCFIVAWRKYIVQTFVNYF